MRGQSSYSGGSGISGSRTSLPAFEDDGDFL